VARFQGKQQDGLRLCEHAMKLQFYEADNHWNLARLHVVASNRQAAVAALEAGLKLDPEHDGLLALAKEIGTRKPPVIRFLHREHPLNRFFGRMRHKMASK
jgi:predicted TPR repeat methyltransferase